MPSRWNEVVTGLVIVLAAVSTISAQTDALSPVTTPEVPYIAEVIGKDVYLRSGAGTVFYFCGKANSPARVTVVNHLHGWSEVIPLGGSFSWISKEYVDQSESNPQVGMVNGNGVRVWAGSDYVEPMRSTSLQVKLNKGDIVKLINPDSQQSDYYKIVPPPGAHLWISSELLKYVGPLPRPALTMNPEPSIGPSITPIIRPTISPVIKPTINPTITPTGTPTVEPTITPTVKPVVTPTTTPTVEPTVTPTVTPREITDTVIPTSTEAKRIKECYDIAEKIREELAKPLEVQDHTAFIASLTTILKDPQSGKAQKYAKYQLDRIKGFELARTAGEDILKQDAELQKIRQQIRDKYKTRLTGIPDPGRHIAKGKIKPSLVFTKEAGQKRYKIINDEGRIVCYAMPAPQAAAIDISSFADRNVGLRGTMVNDRNNPVGLVIFTAVEDLQTDADTSDKTTSDKPTVKIDTATSTANTTKEK